MVDLSTTYLGLSLKNPLAVSASPLCEVVPRLTFSSPHGLLLRLHWVAILYGHIRADLAVTGGVHTARDVLKVLSSYVFKRTGR